MEKKNGSILGCANCNADIWGACYHQEYGKCLYADAYFSNITKIFTENELQNLNAFELWSLAEKMKIPNFEHMLQSEIIEDILNLQKKLTINL